MFTSLVSRSKYNKSWLSDSLDTSDVNKHELPGPTASGKSRLPAPSFTSRLKAPATASKQSRSPEQLPGPTASGKSRLPAPSFTSRLKAPATASKRSRSPEQLPGPTASGKSRLPAPSFTSRLKAPATASKQSRSPEQLPGPTASGKSRLPAPSFTSRLKAPATASKRSRSPEQLPGPTASGKSRLPAPSFTSRLKAPATASKRSRSPEQGPSAKRQRTTVENVPKRSTENPAKQSIEKPAKTSIENPAKTSIRNPAKKPISKENVRPSVSVSKRRSLNKTKLKAAVAPAKPAKGNTKPAGGGPTKTATAPKAGGTKRPAWDVKGRLEDMEKSMKLKESQIAQWTARIGSLESANCKLTGTVAQAEQEATTISKDKQQLEQKLAETESKLNKITQQHEHDTEVLETTKRQKEALERKVTALRTELADLEVSLTQATAESASLKVKLSSTESLLTDAENVKQQQAETILQLKEVVRDFEQQCRQFETERRILHNTVQELKGNIRVFCRVRPLLGDELLGNDGTIQHMDFINDKTIELAKVPSNISLSETMINNTRKASQTGRYSFSFDKVFLPKSTQSEVFEEISQLVQSSLDGYNVCIFAYGQTGSGKTFTMEGPSIEDGETMGMISRATLQIFNSTKNLEDQGWQYEFEASFLEIYNETIRDLLGQHDKDVKHTIRPAGDGKDVTVTNLTTKSVRRKEEIIQLLRTASKNRAVGETKCNERSSRSHSVFRLKITGANEITGENCAGTLNLIDLAGSERLKESGATGARLKETQNMNTSLSALGNVIMALGNKKEHVPYRNSRLTFLLQNSLGGNSKTLMFVNVSPKEEHFSETVNSLRFASKVNQCNIGTATAKTKHGK